jgi:hypothetical protein
MITPEITPYALGYFAALFGIPRYCNPWPLVLVHQRLAWADGHLDACEDAKPRPRVRLQAEFEVR